MKLYLMLNGTQVGPYQIQDVQGWIKAGYVTMEDPAWYDGCEDWITVKEIPKINEVITGDSVGGHLVPPFEAYYGNEPFIFISYAHKDSARVFKEISALNDAGYHVWYDEGIEASSEWPEEIANAVIECSVFLVFISPRSTASVNCRNEINLALNEDKPFLAVHLEESALPPGLRLRMGDLQAILQYKLPQDRYQKKVRDALDQLLGKKKKKSKSRPASASVTTFANMESYDSETGSKRKRKNVSKKATFVKPVTKQKKKTGLWIGILTALAVGFWASYISTKEDFPENNISVPKFTMGEPWTIPSIGLVMNWCEPSVFSMGSPDKEKGREKDESRHEVTLTQGFYLGKFEVTQAEWKVVMGTSPSKFFGPNRPVEQITWDQAKRFCEELNLIEQNDDRLPEGWKYDLPTEAQWEYACRAGTDTMFYWGGSIGPSHANYKDNGINETTEVGKYPSNNWGFHDMTGNVNEWCSDWYAPFDSKSVFDPIGPDHGNHKSIRGGCWANPIELVRVSKRHHMSTGHKSSYKGFRICLKQVSAERNILNEQVAGSIPPVLDLTRGLAGWWKFDETSGRAANDSSGRKRDGILKNFAANNAHWVKGPVGNALRFDGVNDHVDVGDFEWGGKCSFSGWVKYNQIQMWSRVFDFGNGEGKNNIVLSNNAKSPDLAFQNFLKSHQMVKIPDFWELGNWIHIVCQVHESGKSDVFKNGKLVVSQKKQLTSKIMRTSQFFGKSNWGGDRFFNGELDDIRLYDRAITEGEVQALFAMGSVTLESVLKSPEHLNNNGLLGWWKFDETGGKVANDATGKNRNAELKNFISEGAHFSKGIIGNCLNFDGKDDWVSVDPNLFEKNIFKDGITVCAWAKHEFESKFIPPMRIFRTLNLVGGGGARWFSVEANRNGQPYFHLGTAANKFTLSKLKFIPNQWHHIGAQINSGGIFGLFDGKIHTLKKQAHQEYIEKLGVGQDGIYGIGIGASPGPLGQWKGQLDDFKIFNRILSQSEVLALYEEGMN